MADHLDELTPAFRDMLVAAQTRTAMEARADERLRTALFDAIQDAFDGHDLLVAPTLALTAVVNRDDGLTTGPTEVGGVAVDPSIGWCLTYPFNLTRSPRSVGAGRPGGRATGGSAGCWSAAR